MLSTNQHDQHLFRTSILSLTLFKYSSFFSNILDNYYCLFYSKISILFLSMQCIWYLNGDGHLSLYSWCRWCSHGQWLSTLSDYVGLHSHCIAVYCMCWSILIGFHSFHGQEWKQCVWYSCWSTLIECKNYVANINRFCSCHWQLNFVQYIWYVLVCSHFIPIYILSSCHRQCLCSVSDCWSTHYI